MIGDYRPPLTWIYPPAVRNAPAPRYLVGQTSRSQQPATYTRSTRAMQSDRQRWVTCTVEPVWLAVGALGTVGANELEKEELLNELRMLVECNTGPDLNWCFTRRRSVLFCSIIFVFFCFYVLRTDQMCPVGIQIPCSLLNRLKTIPLLCSCAALGRGEGDLVPNFPVGSPKKNEIKKR